MRTSFWTRLLDLTAPRTCAICGNRLSVNERVICPVCHLHLSFTGYEHDPLSNPMARLFWGQFPIERAAALFFYNPHSVTNRLIYDMKYHHRPEIAQYMGIITARQMADAGFFDGIDVLVPMPITWRRQWQRGYNQSKEIARGIRQITGIPICDNSVVRTHFAESQTGKHGWERRLNVEDAFRLKKPHSIEGKHLLLVDDIVTTGATVIACARELAQARDVRISVLSLGLTKS